MYYSAQRRSIKSWNVTEYKGALPSHNEIRWELRGTSRTGDITVDRYLLHHSRYLEMPLLWIHKNGQQRRPVMIWLGENGKAGPKDWPEIAKVLEAGYDIVSFDPRGLGETRMPYKAESPDDPALAKMSFEEAYVSPLSGVLADYVYNSVLTGRPYFLQMLEDVEIASRFSRVQLKSGTQLNIGGNGNAFTLASSSAEVLPNIKFLPQGNSQVPKWSAIIEEKRELWPIQLLLPGGAYIQ
jgi:hypothetical protein